MAKLNQQKFVHKLQIWWIAVSHPPALTKVTKECFASHIHKTTNNSSLQIPTDTLPTRQGELSAFETAIILAAQSIPGPKDQDA
ncbi:hypothetical protein BU23DRAFT_62638 [Bimuria novae-zelandiae CBS 107.79]|uniref:Uncharacterized protein n=1 Tax=Bimuria novae-zelandiae CBS 107.79 TaxID=1447943 RepID=A0A6A5UIF5_9PLEO|nr:hypothetical protein BU23DRAFT_62638 [Bimuria novae-zelandiae CBS 107.79]